MRIWRISTRDTVETACSGEGARKYGGRWNKRGTSVIYASGTLSLCVLETLVHTDSDLLPRLYAYAIDVPDALTVEDPLAPLPTEWRQNPAPEDTQEIGSNWAVLARSAVFRVPSVIVTAEWNYLINPSHPDFRKILLQKDHEFSLDERLRR